MNPTTSTPPAADPRQALLRLKARLAKNPNDGHALDQTAVILYQAGQFEPAVNFAQRAAAALPRDPIVLDHLGLILLAASLPAEAVAAARRATAIAPREGALWLNLGNALLAAGDPSSAVAALAKATALMPREPLAWFNLGNSLAQQRRHLEAITALKKSLVFDPKLVPARRNLALLLRECGQPAEAAAILAPLAGSKEPDLLHLLGTLRLDVGAPADALGPLQAAAHALPDDLGVSLDLARCLVRLERKPEAARLCELVTRRMPEHATAWNILGLCTDDNAAAITCFRRALALHPGFPDAANNLARRLVDDERAAEALPIIDAALAAQPDHPELQYTRGVALLRLDRSSEALAANLRAVERRPEYADAHWNRALCELRLGDFAKGWPDYEWRWRHQDHEKLRYEHIPGWPADCPRQGHLLLWSEQGVGDEVMFATLLPAVRALADRITVTCCPRLVPLFARSFPAFTFIAQIPDRRVPDPVIEADWQLPIGSLPARLWTPAGHPSKGQASLVADPDVVARLRTRYHSDHRPSVGIAWRTSNSKNGRARTIAPEIWAPVLREVPARFISLQYGDCTAELATAAATGLDVFHDSTIDQMRDLDSFAAQIAALDAVLTIDNSTVHFAGALGRPAWLLVPTPADWRWRSEGDTTPWYQSVRIHRRSLDAPWEPVLARAAAELTCYLQSLATPPRPSAPQI
ncbi:MAG TPA: tetratricopeptide repeat protein [Opitutaceae bacterium]|nr:tetratricopeptide repeat protein [Opitutaceae bacterium]